MPKKIIIDTDPGVDDAMAILFALRSPELNVVGMTAIFGNTDVDITVRNALWLAELEGNNHIPVAKGAHRPLVVHAGSMGKHVHGEDGLGGINPPPPMGKPLDIPAAQFIVETILSHPGEITLVPVGPLTNIALALRLEPKIADLTREVVMMGGAAFVPGNASPLAEANVFNDPHAANIVLSADWPLTMVGLDVTMKCIMTNKYLTDLGMAGNPSTDLFHRILPFYQDYHDQIYAMSGDIHTHDPSAIAYLIDSSLFQTKTFPVVVETEGRCSGQTIPYTHHQIEDASLINVCLDVKSKNLLDLYWDRLTKEHSSISS